jgi:hypothetical protein
MGASRIRVAVEQAPITRRGPTLRQASLDDYHQIASLEAAHGLSIKSFDEWAHLHLCNPLNIEGQAGCPIGWVIESDDKEIVASVGNILLPYEFDERRILAATGRGLVASHAYRSASLLLLDQLINQPGVDLFLTNALTPASDQSFSALGCERVPVGEWDRSAFWITNYQGFMESALIMKNSAVARLLSYPLAPAAFLKDWLTNPGLRETDAEIQACPGFDERLDDFWEHVRSKHPCRLQAVRSREVLEWHFRYALLQNRLWIATVVDGPRIAAYAIFDRRDNANFGLKRVRLTDFQSHDGTTALLEPLLSWALRKCRQKGIHMLENVGAWLGKGDLIDKLAPHGRRLSTWTFVYRANNPGLAERLQDQCAWAPTLFDASASL